MAIRTVLTMLQVLTQCPYSSLVSIRKMRKLACSKVKRLLKVTLPSKMEGSEDHTSEPKCSMVMSHSWEVRSAESQVLPRPIHTNLTFTKISR